jgi:hypothetical protein
LTGSATRNPRLVGGDKGRNKKTGGFLAGKQPALRAGFQNAHLLCFHHPSPFNVPDSTPHGSGFRGPCIWTFLNSLQKRLFQHAVREMRENKRK